MKTHNIDILARAFTERDLAVANDQSIFHPRFEGNANVNHGTVFAANDANFDAQYLSEPLQEYIVGAPEDDGIEAILNAIAPAIPVGRSFTYRIHDTREQFQDDANTNEDIREIGGGFAEIRRTGTQTNGRTANKGLTMVLDNDQGGEDTNVQRRAVLNLRTRLFRSDLRRALTAIDANASLGSLTNSVNWGPSATKPDPDSDILTDVDAGGDVRGLDGNIVIEGGSARIQRIKSLRSSVNPAISINANLSGADRAQFYGVDSVVTVKNRRQVSASAKAKILGSVVYTLYTGANLMPDDPSNIKRFVSSTPQGIVRVYVQPMLKRTLITVEHYSLLAITSTLGITKRTVTFT